MQRKTIGTNPFDLVIPTSQGAPLTSQQTVHEVVRPDRIKKERLTVHLPIGLIERTKNCVYWTPGLTLAGLAETALTQIIGEIEDERGEPFPHRNQNLKGGRPMK